MTRYRSPRARRRSRPWVAYGTNAAPAPRRADECEGRSQIRKRNKRCCAGEQGSGGSFPQLQMMAVTIKESRSSYAETIAQLSRAIVDAGNTVFVTIDQAAAAGSVGMTLRPTTLIIFGNPRGGTPFMNDFPLVALDAHIQHPVMAAGITELI